MAKAKKKGKKGLGHLYKRDAAGRDLPATSKAPGTFWLAYRNDEGRRIRVRLEAATLDEAKAEQARLRAPVLTNTQVESLRAELGRLETRLDAETDEANPPLTISDAWGVFELAANRPECGYDTMRLHRSHWEKFVAWYTTRDGAGRFLRDITEADAGEYMTEFGRGKITANTYNKRIGFFKLFFRVLAKPARIVGNPFSEITRRRMQQKSRRELSLSELRAVLLTSSGEMQRLFWIGTFTGLRLGDCCTLLWSEVDFAAGVVRRLPRKTHTSGRPVVVGIPQPLERLLSAIPARERERYVCPRMAARYLKSRTEQTNISREIQAFFLKCGIQTTEKREGCRAAVLVGFHSLRHTYASIHAAYGTPQAVIQDNMGHSSPGMTAHYEHVSDETARRVAAALDIPQITEAGPGATDARDKLRRIADEANDFELAVLLAAWNRLKADDLVTDDGEEPRE